MDTDKDKVYEQDPDEARDRELLRAAYPEDEPYPFYCHNWERFYPIGRRG